jgi:hypothetical protein
VKRYSGVLTPRICSRKRLWNPRASIYGFESDDDGPGQDKGESEKLKATSGEKGSIVSKDEWRKPTLKRAADNGPGEQRDIVSRSVGGVADGNERGSAKKAAIATSGEDDETPRSSKYAKTSSNPQEAILKNNRVGSVATITKSIESSVVGNTSASGPAEEARLKKAIADLLEKRSFHTAKMREHRNMINSHAVKIVEHAAKIKEHSAMRDEHVAKVNEYKSGMAEHTTNFNVANSALGTNWMLLRQLRGEYFGRASEVCKMIEEKDEDEVREMIGDDP